MYICLCTYGYEIKRLLQCVDTISYMVLIIHRNLECDNQKLFCKFGQNYIK